MSSQHQHGQVPDASGRPACPPSVQELLAACAAARTVSTPPLDPAPADGPDESQESARRGSGRRNAA